MTTRSVSKLRGTVRRRSLSGLAAALVCIGCTAPIAQSQAPSETATVTASASTEPTPPNNATPNPTVESTPSAPAGRFAPDQIAAIVTTDLVVRSAPGTGADSEIYPGYYTAPMSVFVVDGPAFADGYEWYLVDAVRGQGIGAYPQPGWVAAAAQDGEPWLGPDPFHCPAPSAADLIHLEHQRALSCYGDGTLTVEGTLAGCQPSIAFGSEMWDTQCAVVRLGFDVRATPDPGCLDCFEPTLWVYFNGDIGLGEVPAGTSITVRGHFDDQTAQACTGDDGFHDDQRLRVHVCRMSFIGTDAEVISS